MRDDKFFQFNEEVPSIELGILLLETKLSELNEQATSPVIPYAQRFETRLFGECLKGSIDRCYQLINEHREDEVPAVLLPFAIYVKEQVHT